MRNSENTVVQFTYGDDGLNPNLMEDNDRPVDFERLRLRITQMQPYPEEAPLSSEKMLKMVSERLARPDFKRLLPRGRVFLKEIRDYFSGLASLQKSLCIGKPTDTEVRMRTWNTTRVTKSQMECLLDAALHNCLRAHVEPGEAVGAVGAQSISEPGTQMTLKVRPSSSAVLFHDVDLLTDLVSVCRLFTLVESVP